MKACELHRAQLFDAEYLFIDGVSRSGKMALAPLISSFQGVEHFKLSFNYERFLDMHDTGHLSLPRLEYLFRSELVLDTWFGMMGRNVNNNAHDLSSIRNSPKYDRYKRREDRRDTQQVFDEIVREISGESPIFPFVTDGYFSKRSVIGQLCPRFKMVVMVRHPIDMVFGWYRSGRGVRFGSDLRFPHPCLSVQGAAVPTFASEWAEQYISSSPLEKCALSVIHHYKSYFDVDEASDADARRCIFVSFEELCCEPLREIGRVAAFIDRSFDVSIYDELDKANMPRKLEGETFRRKALAVFDGLPCVTAEALIEICEMYEARFSGLLQIADTDFEMSDAIKVSDFTSIDSGSGFIEGRKIV